MVFFYMVLFAFVTPAVKRLDIGIGHAIWPGLGTVLIVTVRSLENGRGASEARVRTPPENAGPSDHLRVPTPEGGWREQLPDPITHTRPGLVSSA